MARNRGWTWTVIISLLVGAVGATVFWLYIPYGHDQLTQQVTQDLQVQRPPVEEKSSALDLRKVPSQAVGSRFQMVADGKEVFLVDLQNGRVWRYFHQTKGDASSAEDEGFLPVAMYYAGKKHYSAAEIESPPGSPGNPSPAGPEGKQPQ
jgi:hypothetical protein